MRRRNGFHERGDMDCPLCNEHTIPVSVHHVEDYYGATMESSEQGFTDIDWLDADVSCRWTLTPQERKQINDAAFTFCEEMADRD